MSKVTRREIVITTRLAQRIALAPSIERALDMMFERQKAQRATMTTPYWQQIRQSTDLAYCAGCGWEGEREHCHGGVCPECACEVQANP